MEFRKCVVEKRVTNELPRMYENWTDFYKWWYPWVETTKDQILTIMDYGTGVVIEYTIEWSYVQVMVAYEGNKPKKPGIAFRVRKALYWLWKSNIKDTKKPR